MKAILMKVAAAGAVASVLAGGVAVAQNTETVTVQAKRAVSTKVVGRTPYGVPIVDVSLGYGVSLAGLDLASNAGVAELSKRVDDAAQAACKEIARQYPNATPSDAECAKAAAKEAMVKVDKLVAAARGTSK